MEVGVACEWPVVGDRNSSTEKGGVECPLSGQCDPTSTRLVGDGACLDLDDCEMPPDTADTERPATFPALRRQSCEPPMTSEFTRQLDKAASEPTGLSEPIPASDPGGLSEMYKPPSLAVRGGTGGSPESGAESGRTNSEKVGDTESTAASSKSESGILSLPSLRTSTSESSSGETVPPCARDIARLNQNFVQTCWP